MMGSVPWPLGQGQSAELRPFPSPCRGHNATEMTHFTVSILNAEVTDGDSVTKPVA